MSHLFPRLCAPPQLLPLFVFLFFLTLFAPRCAAHMVMSGNFTHYPSRSYSHRQS